MKQPHGILLRNRLNQGTLPFIGIYDAFSATVAARHYDALFLSGFGFAASYWGLPDIGFVAWPDIIRYVQRLRAILPAHHLLVDIDDGFCDTEVACHVAASLETLGASGVVLEDQRRPRKCGHFEGKQVLELEEYVDKLTRVLAARKDLFVVARTDATGSEEILRRLTAYAAAGADAVLVDGVTDLDLIREARRRTTCPLAFNQIAGGKSPPCTLSRLTEVGVSLVIYSTPCLFAAQAAMEAELVRLRQADGLLASSGTVGVKECTALLKANLPDGGGR